MHLYSQEECSQLWNTQFSFHKTYINMRPMEKGLVVSCVPVPIFMRHDCYWMITNLHCAVVELSSRSPCQSQCPEKGLCSRISSSKGLRLDPAVADLIRGEKSSPCVNRTFCNLVHTLRNLRQILVIAATGPQITPGASVVAQGLQPGSGATRTAVHRNHQQRM